MNVTLERLLLKRHLRDFRFSPIIKTHVVTQFRYDQVCFREVLTVSVGRQEAAAMAGHMTSGSRASTDGQGSQPCPARTGPPSRPGAAAAVARAASRWASTWTRGTSPPQGDTGSYQLFLMSARGHLLCHKDQCSSPEYLRLQSSR